MFVKLMAFSKNGGGYFMARRPTSGYFNWNPANKTKAARDGGIVGLVFWMLAAAITRFIGKDTADKLLKFGSEEWGYGNIFWQVLVVAFSGALMGGLIKHCREWEEELKNKETQQDEAKLFADCSALLSTCYIKQENRTWRLEIHGQENGEEVTYITDILVEGMMKQQSPEQVRASAPYCKLDNEVLPLLRRLDISLKIPGDERGVYINLENGDLRKWIHEPATLQAARRNVCILYTALSRVIYGKTGEKYGGQYASPARQGSVFKHSDDEDDNKGQEAQEKKRGRVLEFSSSSDED